MTVFDGCEWCPEYDRPALENDTHYSTTRSSVLVGSRVNWRLCADCAELPAFKKYRRRVPIPGGHIE